MSYWGYNSDRCNEKTLSGAFTLVELLVVISIISLLMSIMMPSLNRAREQANRMDCMSNMRQLTLSWMMYAHDNDGKLCSPDTGWIDYDYGLPCPSRYGRPHWVLGGPSAPTLYYFNHIGDSEIAIKEGVLWPYVQNIDIYHCKMHSDEFLRSYSMSNTMGGQPLMADLYRKWQFNDIANISRPSEKLVFIDAKTGKRWLAWSFFPIQYSVAETLRWGSKKGIKKRCWREYQLVTQRHCGGCNISFADGHCKYWKYEDWRTVKLAEEELWPSNPVHEDNADLEYLAKLLKGCD
ncbi:MAG: type II secretion system protein [Planctomycetes bacterium]|nr:type II secretion system protein [Planctomycetota bacterium]